MRGGGVVVKALHNCLIFTSNVAWVQIPMPPKFFFFKWLHLNALALMCMDVFSRSVRDNEDIVHDCSVMGFFFKGEGMVIDQPCQWLLSH